MTTACLGLLRRKQWANASPDLRIQLQSIELYRHDGLCRRRTEAAVRYVALQMGFVANWAWYSHLHYHFSVEKL